MSALPSPSPTASTKKVTSEHQDFWNSLLRQDVIKAGSWVVYTIKFGYSFEKCQYHLHLVQVNSEKPITADITLFVVSGEDWLHIVNVSKASQDEASTRAARSHNETTSDTFESLQPWLCTQKNQVYVRSTIRMTGDMILLEADQSHCLLCGVDVTDVGRTGEVSGAANDEAPLEPVHQDRCRPALGFSKLAKRQPDGDIDYDSCIRKGSDLPIIRAAELNLEKVMPPPLDPDAPPYTGLMSDEWTPGFENRYEEALAGMIAAEWAIEDIWGRTRM